MSGMFGMGMAIYRATGGGRIDVETTKDAVRAKSDVNKLKWQIRMLEANMAKTLMINEALWEIVRDNFGLDELALEKKVNEVDMRDGVLDGKNQRKAIKCPSCAHMVSPRHPACLYCGKVIDQSIFSIE